MKLLLVSARHHPEHGGIGTYVRSLIRVTREAGWHIDLLTRSGGPGGLPPLASRVFELSTLDDQPEFQERISDLRRIERIRPYRYGVWSLAIAEFLLACETDYDAVLFMDVQAEGLVSICSAKVRERFAGVPFLVMAHGPMNLVETISNHDADRFGRSIYHEWERRSLAHADGTIGTSELLLSAIGPFEKSCAIPPLLDPPRSSLEVNSDPIILMVGDVELHKGPDVWAMSLNRVFDHDRTIEAQLIGSDTPNGPDDTSLAAHVHTLIEPHFRHRFRWSGPLSHGGTLEAIARSALVVVPSRFDSFSYVAAEAILRETPLVVSDQVGIKEWVEGLEIVPNGNVEALALRQIEILQESSDSNDRRSVLRQQLLEACAPRRYLDSLAGFIQSCLGSDSWIQMGDDSEAIETMKSFLAHVERMERENCLRSGAQATNNHNFTPQVVETR